MDLGYGHALDGLSIKPLITSEEEVRFFLYFLGHCSQDIRYIEHFYEVNPGASDYDEETKRRCFADFITREYWNKKIELAPIEPEQNI